MKNLYPLLMLLLTAGGLSAQIQKGSVLLGGYAGFNNYSSEGGNSFSTIDIAPAAGFFLSDRFALGTSVDFSMAFSNGNSTTSFGLIPFVRYYLNESGPTRFFGHGAVGLRTGGDSFDDGVFASLGIGIGADFFLNDHVAIEALVDFEHFNGVNRVGLNFGIAAFIHRGDKAK